jgi:hypothetical protein
MTTSPPPPKKRGRPALDPGDRRSISVAVRLDAREYDRLFRRATIERTTVPELLRQGIKDPGN